jgi:hypothetical protein
MQHLHAVEAELNSYLQGIIEQWHKAPAPGEREVREHVRSLFARLASDEERRYLQEKTVDLLEKALTFIRLDT